MKKFIGYLLPSPYQPKTCFDISFGSIAVEMPSINAGILADLMNHLRQSQQEFLSHQTTERLLSICDEAVSRWLDPDAPGRRLAEDALHHTTGFSKPMITSGLSLMLEGLRAEALRSLLKEELGDPIFLDEFLPRLSSRSKAFGPRLITHYLAGNIPGLSAHELVRSILLKSSGLFKVSSDEPVFTALFAKTLVEVESGLSDCIAVLSWKGGSDESRALEDVALQQADMVIATGDENTMKHIRSRLSNSSGSRLLTHGHRISFGLIGRESMDNPVKIAEKAAADVSIYDQMGCLSPHLFYVESGGNHHPRDFASALAKQLIEIEKSFPQKKISPETLANLQQFRALYEMKLADGQDITIFKGNHGSFWTVVYEGDPTFSLSPLYRTIRIKPLEDLFQVEDLLNPWRQLLQSVGISVSEERQVQLSELLGSLGVNRICPLGQMQSPPTGWPQDGRPMFSDLVRWVNLEEEKEDNGAVD